MPFISVSRLVGLSRDVNGDPIPANPWRIPLLGYGYGTKIVPMGMDMVQNLHPLGKRGMGLGSNNPNPITHGYFIRVHLLCLYERVEAEPATKLSTTAHQAPSPSPTRQLAD
jgi:hypothetical protein